MRVWHHTTKKITLQATFMFRAFPGSFGDKLHSPLSLLYVLSGHTYYSNKLHPFFIVAPCIWIYVEFTHQQMHFLF